MGVIPNLGVPYYMTSSTSLSDGTDVTIEPGTELVFQSGYRYGIEVGWNYGKAKLTAVGTAAAPIVFRGDNDGIGTWGASRSRSSASTDSKFDRRAAARYAGLALNVAAAVTNTNVSQSDGFGIAKQSSNMLDYTVTNTFADNAKGDIGSL